MIQARTPLSRLLRVLAEMRRVARAGAVVVDLRRSRLAALLFFVSAVSVGLAMVILILFMMAPFVRIIHNRRALQ